jgi:hypothetical protein
MPAAKRNQTSRFAISVRRRSSSGAVPAVAVLVVVSTQSPLFVVVVTPLTELTEMLHELLVEQSPLLVVVVAPFTDVTDTLHDDELLTTTLLDTVEPLLVDSATVVSSLARELSADA